MLICEAIGIDYTGNAMNSDFTTWNGKAEVKRRDEEVKLIRRNLTPAEIEQALMDYSNTKWHRLQGGENPSFKAGNIDAKINIVK